MPPINWTELAAIATVVTAVGGAGIFILRYAVRDGIREEIEKLDVRYVRKDLADERHEDHSRRLSQLEIRSHRS